jgi:hypothetical protein
VARGSCWVCARLKNSRWLGSGVYGVVNSRHKKLPNEVATRKHSLIRNYPAAIGGGETV